MSIAETAEGISGAVGYASDAVTASDTATATQGLTRVTTDAVTTSDTADAVVVSGTVDRTATDAVSLSDAASASVASQPTPPTGTSTAGRRRRRRGFEPEFPPPLDLRKLRLFVYAEDAVRIVDEARADVEFTDDEAFIEVLLGLREPVA